MNLFKLLGKGRPAPPTKHLTAKDLEFGFRDTSGIRYYRINTQLGIGLEHFGKATEFATWMASGLSPVELDRLIDHAESVMEGLVQGKKGNLAEIGWVLREMRMRKNLVIHTELLYQYIACFYIREDEPVNEWIESIHNEKVEAFKLCVKERTAYDFFQLPELKNTSAITSMSKEEFEQHWSDSTREQAALGKKIEYLKSVRKSAPKPKPSKKVF